MSEGRSLDPESRSPRHRNRVEYDWHHCELRAGWLWEIKRGKQIFAWTGAVGSLKKNPERKTFAWSITIEHYFRTRSV